MEPNHETQQQQRATDSTGQSTRIFVGHVKQYLLSLPWATVTVILLTLAIALIDLVIRLLTPHQNFISQWLYMDLSSVVHHWQGIYIYICVCYLSASSQLKRNWLNGDDST
ncbi:hypothetical protein BCR43DRAFT_163555 [Syncephalastrum racemosum]|uniref:Uncharacterized protein n=1 Tax=Syncephalastrum racemosum TaxID=13706 RepID=A0A1X2HNT6_SYNRA|nr:hypothetical protein BCR43DRAFT_163555 [Syncephalastrum racemosum]